MPDLSFWAESRWNRPGVRPYGFRSTAYTTGLHRGQDAPAGDWGTYPIPAIRAGRVVATYRTTALGWIVVVDAGQGVGAFRFDCYCHLAQQDAAALGATLRAGDSVGRAAREWEAPGIVGVTWLGMHIHLVISTVVRGGDSVYAPTTDPRPIIRAALGGSPASGGSTPYEEDDMQADEREALMALKTALLDGRPENWTDRPIDRILRAAEDVQNRIYITDKDGKRVWDVFQELLPNVRAILTTVQKLAASDGDVDEAELARELAPTLAPLLLQNLRVFDDETIAAFARAAADEEDRRDRERLGPQ